MVICTYFQQGRCRFGDRCKNEHPGVHGGFGGNRFGVFGQANKQPGRFGGFTQGGQNETYGLHAEDIRDDLTPGKNRPMWIFSAYGPGRDAPVQLFGGPTREQSFEEMRALHYDAAAKGNAEQAVQDANRLYAETEAQIKTIVDNADAAVDYIINGRDSHPNRLDTINGKMGLAAPAAGPFGQPAASPFGQQQRQHQSPFGKPSAFGQPSFGQPSSLGQSAFGKPAFGQPSFGQPSFGQPSFGQPSFGQPSFGQHSFGQPSFGKPSFGQPSFGQPSFGQPSLGQPSFSQPSQPGGSSGFGQSPFGAAAQGTGTGTTGTGFGAFGKSTASPFSAIGQNSGSSPFGGAPSASAQPAPPNPFAAPSGPAAGVNANPFSSPAGGTAAGANANPFAALSKPAGGPSPFGGMPSAPATLGTTATTTTSGFGAPAGGGFASAPALPKPTKLTKIPDNINPLLRLTGETQRDPATNRLTYWKGQPVQYVDGDPRYQHPEHPGLFMHIFFPDGRGPEQSRDAVAPANKYTPDVEEAYKYLKQTGMFKDGIVPLVPPRPEWLNFDF